MAIYDWPNTRALLPLQAELRVIDNTQRALDSPLSGFVQSLGMPGTRWGWSMEFGAQTRADRDAVEAMLLKLSGRQHRARLWDLKRPRPLGNIGLTGVTLGAAAAQFATTLQLAGCRAARNLLLGSGFEVHASGPAAPWSSYSTGSTGAVSFGSAAGIAADGALCQRVAAINLGTTTADTAGIYQTVNAANLAGKPFALSATVAAYDGAPKAALYVTWRDGVTVLANDSISVSPSASPARYTLLGTAPANATAADVFVWMHSRSGGSGVAVMDVDSAQLEVGASATAYAGPATLAAGDWIGLAGGQLVRVVADATASDMGAMTVDVRHMLRAAVASGSAVTLDRPTALYVRTEAGIALPRQPGMVEPGMSVEFVEVFA